MGQNESKVKNKVKNVTIGGNYIGGDMVENYNIVLPPNSEHDFVVTHNANIRPVSYFTGRETELQELREEIESASKILLVSGMGGIGKTQICRKLFEEYFNKHMLRETELFQHIGYIEYSRDINSSLQQCLRYKEQDSPEKNREAVWRELEDLTSKGRLLLFIDNVDKSVNEDPDLQRLNMIPCTVVLSSRQTSFGDEFKSYPIGFPGMDQCVEIFKKIYLKDDKERTSAEDLSDLEYIIETLAGRHTITVEYLAHLAKGKLWSIKRLREELEEKGFRLQFHKDGKIINIQESYEILYDLSRLTEAEQNILEAFSMFPYIPLEAEMCNEWLLEDAGASEDDDILMELYRKGWLQLEQSSYMLHPVFARFIYEKCKPGPDNHIRLINACEKSITIPKNGWTLECQKYIPFAESILEKTEVGISGLKDKLAHLLLSIAEYEKAEKLYKEILETYKAAKDDLNMITVYYNLSALYDKKGEYKEEEEMVRKELQILERMRGNLSAKMEADCYSSQALVYFRKDRKWLEEKIYTNRARAHPMHQNRQKIINFL